MMFLQNSYNFNVKNIHLLKLIVMILYLDYDESSSFDILGINHLFCLFDPRK